MLPESGRGRKLYNAGFQAIWLHPYGVLQGIKCSAYLTANWGAEPKLAPEVRPSGVARFAASRDNIEAKYLRIPNSRQISNQGVPREP